MRFEPSAGLNIMGYFYPHIMINIIIMMKKETLFKI